MCCGMILLGTKIVAHALLRTLRPGGAQECVRGLRPRLAVSAATRLFAGREERYSISHALSTNRASRSPGPGGRPRRCGFGKNGAVSAPEHLRGRRIPQVARRLG